MNCKIVCQLVHFFPSITLNRNAQEETMLVQKMRQRMKIPFPSLIATTLQRIILKIWWMNMCHPGLSVKRKIKETEMSTRGQSQNPIWFEKRKSILTASNFGKAAKTKVEPSNKLKAMLYSNFTTEAVQYSIESEEKAVKLYLREMQQQGFNLKVEEVGLLVSRKKPYWSKIAQDCDQRGPEQ